MAKHVLVIGATLLDTKGMPLAGLEPLRASCVKCSSPVMRLFVAEHAGRPLTFTRRI